MEKKQKQNKAPMDAVQEILNIPPSKSDPQGMWTGKPVHKDEVPVQDNDDL